MEKKSVSQYITVSSTLPETKRQDCSGYCWRAHVRPTSVILGEAGEHGSVSVDMSRKTRGRESQPVQGFNNQVDIACTKRETR